MYFFGNNLPSNDNFDPAYSQYLQSPEHDNSQQPTLFNDPIESFPQQNITNSLDPLTIQADMNNWDAQHQPIFYPGWGAFYQTPILINETDNSFSMSHESTQTHSMLKRKLQEPEGCHKKKKANYGNNLEQDIEVLVKKQKTYSLTQEEKDELKRKMNVMAARNSRQRKKEHLFKLEDKVETLTNQVTEFKREIASLKAENEHYQNENLCLKTLLANNWGLFPNANNNMPTQPDFDNQFDSVTPDFNG